jgi:hypothetical protein
MMEFGAKPASLTVLARMAVCWGGGCRQFGENVVDARAACVAALTNRLQALKACRSDPSHRSFL